MYLLVTVVPKGCKSFAVSRCQDTYWSMFTFICRGSNDAACWFSSCPLGDRSICAVGFISRL
jgi:hypothetical protein